MASNPQEYYTCTSNTLAGCVSTDVATTNVAPSTPGFERRCAWTCGQPGANVVNLLVSLSNPSNGVHSALPLYTYNLIVRVFNNQPAFTGIVDSVTMVPFDYFPSSRTLPSNLFVIDTPATEVGGTYKQKFNLNGLMTIYPDETLVVAISITFGVNATELMSTSVALDIEPYDICTAELTVNAVPGTDGTPCAMNHVQPTGDLGKILPRAVVSGAPLAIAFPATCPALCNSLSTSSTTLATITLPPTPPTTPPTTATATTATATLGQIMGQAFFDANGDGFYQPATESIARNLRFQLYSAANHSIVASTNTDSNGVYRFTGVSFTFYVGVLGSTLPYGYMPTIVPASYAPAEPANLFHANTLLTAVYSVYGADAANVDLGLVPVPGCARATPPSTPTHGIQVEFQSSSTSCTACSSLSVLRSKCSPKRCANLITRQFIDVYVTVSNHGLMMLGRDSLAVRLNSIGVGPHEADLRPYSCAEAFAIDAVNGYSLSSGSEAVTSPSTSKGLATAAFGWKSLAVGTDVVTAHAQFIYCSSDVITYFNITAEILDDSCVQSIVAWNRCNQTIDIRTCQATLAANVPRCAGCPPTPPPSTTLPHATTLPESQLDLTVQPYCFSPLCVNSQTFVELRCRDTAAALAQCEAAANRGEVMYQAVVTNPSSAPPSEPGALVVHYQRHAIGDEQLVCGEKYGDGAVLPVYVIVDLTGAPSPFTPVFTDKTQNTQTQTADFTVAFPSLAAGQQFIVSLIAFECSAHALNVTFSASINSLRCRDASLCSKLAPPMPSLTSCVRYRTSGCTEDVPGVLGLGFGLEHAASNPNSQALWPYIIAALIFLLIAALVIFIILRKRRRNMLTAAKMSIAAARATTREPERYTGEMMRTRRTQ